MAEFLFLRRYNGNQLRNCWLLGHGIDKFITDQEYRVNITIGITFQHRLYRTDNSTHLGPVTNMAGLGNNFRTNSLIETECLATESNNFNINTLVVELTNFIQRPFENIGIEAPAETAIG